MTPELWLKEVCAYLKLQKQELRKHLRFHLSGSALQWWDTTRRWAKTKGLQLTTKRIRREFVKQYGDPLKVRDKDWARRQLHSLSWVWVPSKEELSVYHQRFKDLLIHAGDMAAADQVSWYHRGLQNSPNLLQKVLLDKDGHPWRKLAPLLEHALNEERAFRVSRAHQSQSNPGHRSGQTVFKRKYNGPRVNAVRTGTRDGAAQGGPNKKARTDAGDNRPPRMPAALVTLLREKNLCTYCHEEFTPGHKSKVSPDGKYKLCPNRSADHMKCTCVACKQFRDKSK